MTSATTNADTANVTFTTGVVTGSPKTILRLEGLAMLAGSIWLYSNYGHGWMLFAALFLVPDLSMLGYLANRRIGAAIYNLGHSYLLPFALVAFGALSDHRLGIAVGSIWLAHIGFDRAVGYGLKYEDAFNHTHLGTPFSKKIREG